MSLAPFSPTAVDNHRQRQSRLVFCSDFPSELPVFSFLVPLFPVQALLALIGDTLMLHLLLHTSIFLPLSGVECERFCERFPILIK